MSRPKRERRRAVKEVRQLCARVIGNLRAVLKQHGPRLAAEFPNCGRPCHTCAFQPSTDNDRGFDSTILSLAHAILRDKPFYCHEPMPRDADGNWMFDPHTAKLCAGYGMIAGVSGEAKRAVVRGFLGLDRPMTDDRADAFVEFMCDLMPHPQQRKPVPWATEEELRPFR